MKIIYVLLEYILIILVFTMGCTSHYHQKKVGEDTAPGTVEIVASVDSLTLDGTNSVVKLKIIKIKSYGPATTPIAENSNITAIAMLSEVISKIKKFKKDETIDAVLKLLKTGINTQNSFKWEIIQII